MEESVRQLKRNEFPLLLSEIPDAPNTLYLRGALPSPETKLLCVVGTRRNSPYGKDACQTLIAGLRGYDIAIISGLALGMDAIAHQAALDSNLFTLAVPGSGLNDDVLYPRTNRSLARDILAKGGGLLSEFGPSFRATPYSFPERNRIMAGMCHATLVVEAGEKSGTLITARLAMEYNRDVMTVPSSIFSKLSYGPHMLIRNGATPVTCSDDILDALHLQRREPAMRMRAALSQKEQKIIDLLAHPMTREELIRELALPIAEINVLLSAMELKGLIMERLGELRSA